MKESYDQKVFRAKLSHFWLFVRLASWEEEEESSYPPSPPFPFLNSYALGHHLQTNPSNSIPLQSRWEEAPYSVGGRRAARTPPPSSSSTPPRPPAGTTSSYPSWAAAPSVTSTRLSRC